MAKDVSKLEHGHAASPDPSAIRDEKPAIRWHELTTARVGIGHVGGTLSTSSWLEFRADHAAARDAVAYPWNVRSQAKFLQDLGNDTFVANTLASDKADFLLRPDHGRLLSPAARDALLGHVQEHASKYDLCVAVSDGLSALAAERHATAVIGELRKRLPADQWNWSPIILVPYGRVAILDAIGDILQPEIGLILIGERPGLGAPDSLGAYLTYAPRQGRTDADRNCVSNIRHAGLGYDAAADTLAHLIRQAKTLRVSGVALKDDRLGSAAELSREG
jgi:ethanolamine ammonia-lyase small subunit